MKQVTLPVPEVGLIGATRGMAGAGAALLFGSRLSDKRRKTIGWPLFLVGAISTVPLFVDLWRRTKATSTETANEPIAKRK